MAFDPKPWDEVYRMLEPAQIPWNAGGPDPDLARLAEAGKLPPGKAVDLGAGPGHDAIYLSKKGFDVLAVDISALAVKLAAANAALAGARIEFRVCDALELSLPDGSVALINDRGLFHFLQDPSRSRYLDLIWKALAPGGLLLLRVFSDKEPPGIGPRRYSKAALESIFSERFEFLEAAEGIFAGPQKPKALFCLLRKK